MLAPHFEQNPLLAKLEELYHFRVFLLIKVILSSKQFVYAAKCRGTIELLRRVVKQLNWKFSNLKQFWLARGRNHLSGNIQNGWHACY